MRMPVSRQARLITGAGSTALEPIWCTVWIANDWKTLNKNAAALQDWGHVLLFEPSAAEVHAQAGKWFVDREIYEWFAANLHRVRDPSTRHDVRARELKAAGMHWTDVLAVVDENRRARLAAELLASAVYGCMAARVKAFVAQGVGCRATFLLPPKDRRREGHS
jgi:hypothetical protein